VVGLFTARLILVVATRLHTQLSSFRLCILSNTSPCSEETHEWNTFANPIRHTLSILQKWLEKRLAEPAQFKTRLQFRRAHQPVKLAFNKLHPKSRTTSNAWTQKSRESIPT
jgi:hypothetical protein